MPTTRDFKLALLLDNDGLTVPVNQDITLDGNTLFVDASTDRVGIGTSSPSRQLEVLKSGVDDVNIAVIGGGSGVGGASVAIGASGTSSYIRGVNNGVGAYVPLNIGGSVTVFEVSASEKMRIDSSGNVGIGTSSPDADAKLDVNGQLLVRNTGAAVDTTPGGQYGFYIQPDSSGTVNLMSYSGGGSTDIQFFTNSGGAAAVNAMTIDSSGNVGIGTSSPTTPLTVAGKGTFSGAGSFEALELITSDTNRVFVTGNSSVSGDMWRLGTSTSNPNLNIDALQSNGEILLRTGGTNERMRIDSSGNVGVGTTSPNQKLAVGGSASGTVALQVTNSTAGTAFNDGMQMFINDTAGGLNMREAYPLQFYVNGSERMRITSGGDVGIGTSSPSTLLHLASTGDAVLTIEADTDNVTETDNPQLRFVQDGGITTARIGFADGTNRMEFVNEVGDGIAFGTSDTERMRILGGGNVGIGTTSPDRLFEVEEASGDAYLRFRASDTGGGADTVFENLCADNGQNNYIYFGDLDDVNIGTIRYSHASDFMSFTVNASEAMRINPNGDILFGTTTSPSAVGQNCFMFEPDVGRLFINAESTAVLLDLNQSYNDTATRTVIRLRRRETQVGSITCSTTATAYNTSSDYRLKENVTDVTDGITRVKQLEPRRFNFIAEPDTTVDGFVAHEVSDIVPEAVFGEKDGVDEDGNPEYQGIDQSKLVPLLTAALQEAISKIESLETRVAALEAA